MICVILFVRSCSWQSVFDGIVLVWFCFGIHRPVFWADIFFPWSLESDTGDTGKNYRLMMYVSIKIIKAHIIFMRWFSWELVSDLLALRSGRVWNCGNPKGQNDEFLF